MFDLDSFVENTRNFGPELQRKFLSKKRIEMQSELDDLNNRISLAAANARTYGRYENSEKFQDMKKKKRELGSLIQKIQVELSHIGQKLKAASQNNRTFKDLFIDAARDMLPTDMFHAIFKEADRRQNPEQSIGF